MSQLCERCDKNPATNSAIIQGIYYQHICKGCMVSPQVSSGAARWDRTIDMEDSQFDVMQPYSANGKINPEFVKAYPKQSKAIFTQKEMDDAIRK